MTRRAAESLSLLIANRFACDRKLVQLAIEVAKILNYMGVVTGFSRLDRREILLETDRAIS
jgi:hypothetical protein